MSRNRTTLISLIACAAVALVVTAPVQSRGGDASEMNTLVASEAVQYQPAPANDMVELDATIQAATIQRDAEIAAYVQAVQAAEAQRLAEEEAARVAAEQAAAEAAEAERREAERRAAEAAAPPPPPPPVVATPSGACGGWGDLIAAYFPGEEARACRVMMCESGGNPTIHNNSSTASGLFQFLNSTWESTTGTAAPASAYSGEVQIAAAAKLRNKSGWGPWVCK